MKLYDPLGFHGNEIVLNVLYYILIFVNLNRKKFSLGPGFDSGLQHYAHALYQLGLPHILLGQARMLFFSFLFYSSCTSRPALLPSVDGAKTLMALLLKVKIIMLSNILTNSMAYGTQRFNAAFTRALQ